MPGTTTDKGQAGGSAATLRSRVGRHLEVTQLLLEALAVGIVLLPAGEVANGIVALAALGLVLADVVPTRRQGRIVGRPVVGAEQARAPGFQPAQQALQRGLVAAVAALPPVDQPAGAVLECLPDPELARFFGMKCQTSSISTTAARPAGSGLGQCRRAWSLIQRITLRAETPRRWPTALSDRPVQ